MSEKLKQQHLVVGALYRSTKAIAVYEERIDLEAAYTNIGEMLPEGSLLLLLEDDVPKIFTWLQVNSQKNVFAFGVPGLELVSLPQERPSKDS